MTSAGETQPQSSPPPRFPPGRAWTLGVVATIAVVAILALTTLVAGPDGLGPGVLGIIGMLGAATHKQSIAWRAGMVALLALVAALAVAVGPDPLLIPLVVAGTALATVPFTVRFGAIALTAPVVPAVAGSLEVHVSPMAAGALVALGATSIVLVIGALGITVLDSPVHVRVAWAHAAVLAVLAAASSATVMAAGLGHGYWMVIGLCVVLSPTHDKARAETSVRIVGTAIGAVTAIALATLLPLWLLLPVAGLSLVSSLAFTAIGRRTWVIALQTITIITAAAAISPESTLAVAAWRFGAIAAGAVLALLAAELVVASVERRVQQADSPDDPAAR